MTTGKRIVLLPLAVLTIVCPFAVAGRAATGARGGVNGGYTEVTVDAGDRTASVVLHALDRDGFCDAVAFGAISIHPVLTDAPNDTIINPTTGLPAPRETVDFFIDSGEGIITGASGGAVTPGQRSATGVPTYSTYANTFAASPIRSFAPLVDGIDDECQAWVTVTGTPGTTVNLVVIVHDDLGDVGFDRVIRLESGTDLYLAHRWTLVTWPGPDGVSPREALSGSGAASGGGNVFDRVTALYGWNSASGEWSGFFPSSAAQPGANDLSILHRGQAYWVAITGPGPVVWRVAGAP